MNMTRVLDILGRVKRLECRWISEAARCTDDRWTCEVLERYLRNLTKNKEDWIVVWVEWTYEIKYKNLNYIKRKTLKVERNRKILKLF